MVDRPLLRCAPAEPRLGARSRCLGLTEGPSRASATGWNCSESSTSLVPVRACTHTTWSHRHRHTHSCTWVCKFILQLGPKFALHPSDTGLLHSGPTQPQGHAATGTRSHRDMQPRPLEARGRGRESAGTHDLSGHP